MSRIGALLCVYFFVLPGTLLGIAIVAFRRHHVSAGPSGDDPTILFRAEAVTLAKVKVTGAAEGFEGLEAIVAVLIGFAHFLSRGKTDSSGVGRAG